MSRSQVWGGGSGLRMYSQRILRSIIDKECFVNMSPGPLLENSNLLQVHSHGEFTKNMPPAPTL